MVGLIVGVVLASTSTVSAQDEGPEPESTGDATIRLVTETSSDEISVDVEFPAPDLIVIDTLEPGLPLTQERPPGTYVVDITTDPEGEWEVTTVECDDGGSGTASIPDPDTRSVAVGIDAGEHVTCIFSVASGEVIIKLETEPSQAMSLDFDVERPELRCPPSKQGCSQPDADVVTVNSDSDGSLRRAPGTFYVEVGSGLDDAEWGVTKVECDDQASENPSSGDPDARRADVSIEPAERVTCTFTVARGDGVIKLKTEPRGRDMTFDFTFPPPTRPCVTREAGGCGLSVDRISLSDGESETVRRAPGLYETRLETDLGERWEVERITCEEGSGENPSFGDKDAKTAIYGIDADEKATCTFVIRDKTVPRKGPWQVTETSSRARCRVPIEVKAGETENLQLGVRDRGRRLIAGPLRLTRQSEDAGNYRGRRRRARIDWQVRSDKHITGTTTTNLGQGCTIIRTFDMRYQGD